MLRKVTQKRGVSKCYSVCSTVHLMFNFKLLFVIHLKFKMLKDIDKMITKFNQF